MAQARLTVSYFKGQGAPRNYTEAARWFGKVAASCFETINGGPLGRWMSILAILCGAMLCKARAEMQPRRRSQTALSRCQAR